MGKLTKAFEKVRKDTGEKDFIASEFFIDESWDAKLQISTNPRSLFFDKFRSLRAPILYPSSGKPVRTILVTSVMPNEGKGFICANLGVALSQDLEHHALLVDCDLRRPTLAQLFGMTNETGLVDYLQDEVELSLLIRKTSQSKLSILPSGKPPWNPSELLSSGRMKKFINEISERYKDRIILFDSPPNTIASETGILAKQLDGVILVIRHGAAPKEDVKKLVDTLGPENIIGVVYNAYPENAIDPMKYKTKYGYSKYYY